MTTPSRFALIAAFFLLGSFAMPASARSPEDMNARIDTLFGEDGALFANSDGVMFGNGDLHRRLCQFPLDHQPINQAE